jgi:O-antigen/teichoic acid export membrane protein
VILSLGNGILLARLLDPGERGLVAQYLYIASMASSAALMLFVPQAITKTVILSGLRNSLKPLATIIGAQCALAITVTSLYVIFVSRTRIELIELALIVVFALVNVCYHGFSAVHRGLGNTNLVSATQPASLLFVNALLLLGLFVRIIPIYVIEIYIFSYIAVVLFLFLRLGSPEKTGIITKPFRITRNEALGLSSVEIVLLFYGFSDRFLLSEYFSLHDFGLYAVASSVAGILFVLQGSLAPILFMQLTEESRISAKQGVYESAIEKMHYFHLTLFSIALSLAISAYFVIPLFFGNMYAQASEIVPLLVFAYYCRSLSTFLDNGIRAAGHSRVSTAVYIAGFAAFGFLAFGLKALGIVAMHLVIPTSIAVAMALEFLLLCSYYRSHTSYSLSSLILIDKERGILAIRKLIVQSQLVLQRK